MADTRFARRKNRGNVKITTRLAGIVDQGIADYFLWLDRATSPFFEKLYFMDEPPLLFPLHFSPIFHALSYFEIDFEIIKISREHGLTSGETRVTRLEFRVLVVESRREVGNKFTGTIEQTAAKLVLPAVKISLDKISKILRL